MAVAMRYKCYRAYCTFLYGEGDALKRDYNRGDDRLFQVTLDSAYRRTHVLRAF